MNRRYQVHPLEDGYEVTQTNRGCLTSLCVVVGIFFAGAAIEALVHGQWGAVGICLLLCGLCLPNLARRR